MLYLLGSPRWKSTLNHVARLGLSGGQLLSVMTLCGGGRICSREEAERCQTVLEMMQRQGAQVKDFDSWHCAEHGY